MAARVFEHPQAHRGKAYRLTGPRTFTFEQAAALLTEATGRAITYVPATLAAYPFHLLTRRKAGLLQAILWTTLHAGLRRGEAAIVDPQLERLLGKPARDLRDFVREHAATWRLREA